MVYTLRVTEVVNFCHETELEAQIWSFVLDQSVVMEESEALLETHPLSIS